MSFDVESCQELLLSYCFIELVGGGNDSKEVCVVENHHPLNEGSWNLVLEEDKGYDKGYQDNDQSLSDGNDEIDS